MSNIVSVDTRDIRFPTSLQLDGSDAMNPAPDYSAAYVILRTSDPGLEGHGFCFTIGRGTELCVQAIRALAPAVVGDKTEELLADLQPEELVALVDFRYLTDALTPAEALALLHAKAPTRREREAHLEAA